MNQHKLLNPEHELSDSFTKNTKLYISAYGFISNPEHGSVFVFLNLPGSAEFEKLT